MTDSAPPPPPPSDPYGQPGPGGYAAPGAVQPGGVGARIGARIIDFIIVGIITSIVVRLVTGGSVMDANLSYGDIAISAVITAVLYLAYFTLGESSRGQTPGKSLLKLKVVGPDGGNPTPVEALKRNLWTALNILGVLGVVGSYIGGVAALIIIIVLIVQVANEASGRITFMDKFAGGTRVVSTR